MMLLLHVEFLQCEQRNFGSILSRHSTPRETSIFAVKRTAKNVLTDHYSMDDMQIPFRI